jgi:hypothetical protein
MRYPISSAVQLRYTGAHGPLVRSDGKTQPITLDDIERLYGEFVFEEVMCSPGRWVDITAPDDAVVAATVNERVFNVHVVPSDSLSSDFIIDVDAGTITLPFNARVLSLLSALHTAKQHEPSIPTQPPRTLGCRCWSTRGGEIAVVILPGIGRREIPMEKAAAHPKLRDIFNRIREADTDAWKWHGEQPPTKKAFVTLSEDEIDTLVDRDGPLPRLRPIAVRPIQLSHTAWGTNPAA